MTTTTHQRPRLRLASDLPATVGLAALLVALACVTTGGFDASLTVSGADTWSEIVLLVVGAIAAGAVLVVGVPGLGPGTLPAMLFGVVTAITALSILWSVQPDDSWQAANLTLAYLAAFTTAIALVRLTPRRWAVVVAGIGLAMVALSAYGLLSKVFPATLAAGESQGRLQVPLDYWNATGAAAAMGLPACLWFWQRGGTAAWARALAVPAGIVLLTVTVLSYSRTTLIVVVVVAAAWLVLVRGRLWAVALIALTGAGAAVLCAWALARPALTGDNQALSARTSAGHGFGVICLVVLLLATAAGWALVTAERRRTLRPGQRRAIERVLLAGLALLPVLAVAALAMSSRGLTGQISHAFSTLTNTNPGVDNGANRVTSLGSSRPLYWSEGITVGEHALLKGVGALGYAIARTRYTTQPEVTGHAHSYVIQTFADLGLIGLAANLALLIAWGRSAAAAIATGTLRPARTPAQPERTTSDPAGARVDPARPPAGPPREDERAGLVALLLVVVAFGLSSTLDWTWYFPGVAVPALLAAGWLAGRGRPGEAAQRPQWVPLGRRPGTSAMLTALAALVLIAGWLMWQPLRASEAVSAVLNGQSTQPFADARTARAADPLALQPLFLLASLERDAHHLTAARAQLVTATQVQPENANSWLQLGSFDLTEGHARRALPSLRRAYELDPTVPVTGEVLAQAEAAIRTAATTAHAHHRRRHRRTAH
ncbi:MAG TPA: O-antigen ligase family protein [Solirubrobacteraceae bacterium]|nr:O-antigen ligase family protein [Solirubrobacteraceae bacterium]